MRFHRTQVQFRSSAPAEPAIQFEFESPGLQTGPRFRNDVAQHPRVPGRLVRSRRQRNARIASQPRLYCR